MGMRLNYTYEEISIFDQAKTAAFEVEEGGTAFG